jgi:Xaa-Pro aminopeptidase
MITQTEYQERRRQLALQMLPDSVAIITSAQEKERNGDAHYRFRQDSDFYYFTGCNEQDAALVIFSGKESRSYLFNLPRDPIQEQWTGKRLGQEGAQESLGVDEAFDVYEFDSMLCELLENKQAIYYFAGRYPHWEKRIGRAWQIVKNNMRRGIHAPESFCDLSSIVGEMRLFKSAQEMTLMRKAAKISVAAHQRAMQACKKTRFEYELEAELMYEFVRGGCRSVAYDSIVAGGQNACILHYTANNQPLNSGDLVLIDAGGEFENYAADITRTFPLNGKYSAEQRSIYELVLTAQKAGKERVRPGVRWYEIQEAILQVLTSGLVELGLLRGNVENLIETNAYKPFYMHNSGHWLGIDVHDCGQYKINNQWRPLKPGMVLTVEPGIYISEDIKNIDPRWYGIGVRIEDDLFVTEGGHENLTSALPIEINEIEALVRGG